VELRKFDESVVTKWRESVSEQEDEMRKLEVPYFDGEDGENKGKILTFLEDLMSAGNE